MVVSGTLVSTILVVLVVLVVVVVVLSLSVVTIIEVVVEVANSGTVKVESVASRMVAVDKNSVVVEV